MTNDLFETKVRNNDELIWSLQAIALEIGVTSNCLRRWMAQDPDLHRLIWKLGGRWVANRSEIINWQMSTTRRVRKP